jgi:NAD(P)-dependent dehydrogenase (short-subunit alcohol dehydrogenase family)
MGRASAVLLAKQGVHVVCCDLRPEANPAGFEDDLHFTTVQMVEKQGSSAFFVKVDISNAAEVEEAFKQTISVSARRPFYLQLHCTLRSHDTKTELSIFF